ncbi:MAG: indole-3-glycerol phosphate synthase TrpC [Ilumatobacteraceae bacterium]
MATYLDRIVARHREVAALDERSLVTLRRAAAAMPPARGFRAALAGVPHLAVISEIKRRSPSKGALNVALDPALLASEYERGGASCLSVLTDEEFFGGCVADLQAARSACSLPVLRKDFTVSERDVLDARLMGADCVLLIAAVLDAQELIAYHRLAVEVGLDVLVEVHDEPELEVALVAGATLVGVNQRDLVTFQVDHERALRMAGVMPSDVVRVAESGVRGPADAGSLFAAGYHAVLVGETLVTSGDPATAVAELTRA